jgi:quercetin 2,3-dioxygenase
VNLPAREKMSPPRYQGLLDANIPRVSLPGEAGTVRVIAGEFQGTRGAATTFTPIHLWDVQLAAAAELDLPQGHTALVVVQSGTVEINDSVLKAVELAELDRAGTSVRVIPQSRARLLVLAGEPIGEPAVGEGPFVMNTREEIRQAIRDYRDGRMGQI